ncbi:MAG TPA: hypothetical protein VGP61_13900 [Gemmatimonadales bacterium]|nr:hypothetical protein [Gemmatimonadales bacterium]
MITRPSVRRLLLLLYLAGALLLADQVADLAASLLANPPAPGQPAWRFGAFGLLMSRASMLLVADVLLFVPAVALEQRRVLRALGVIHLGLALGLLAGLSLFALDWLQIRKSVRETATRPFDGAALRAGVVAALVLGLSAWTGITVLRVTRGRGRGSRRAAGSSVLITPQPREQEKPSP